MAGNFDYDRKKDTVVCWREIGSFFVVAENFHYDRTKKDTLRPEKKRYSRLRREISIFFVVAGNFDYDREKKDTVVCWREIGSFFVVAGNFHYDQKKKIHYDRKKKIQSSVWRVVPLCQFLVLAGN